MIDYSPLWETLKKKHISTYYLINTYKMSSSQVARFRHNLPVTTTTLDDLCRILHCEISDIVRYLPDEPAPDTPEAP